MKELSGKIPQSTDQLGGGGGRGRRGGVGGGGGGGGLTVASVMVSWVERQRLRNRKKK